MNRNTLKKLCATVAALALLASHAPALAASATLRGEKEEVVYARLAPDGAVRSAFVVNRFDVDTPGDIVDQGRYQSVENLSGTQPAVLDGDTVTLPAEAGSVYYQGQLRDAALPWHFDIRYTLDGQDIAAEALAGQSGALQIHIATRQNPNADPVFYENYMLQITASLDAGLCQDIVSDGATIASAGQSKAVVHTVLPGQDADITIAASVRDFSMSGLEISGLPLSLPIELPDTDSMTEGLDTLVSAIADVNGGAAQLAQGAADLHTGADTLAQGAEDFGAGFASLDTAGAQLTSGSGQIGQALQTLATALSTAEGAADAEPSADDGGASLAALAQLPDALDQLASGTAQASEGLAAYKDGLTAMIAALDAAIASIPQDEIAQADIAALMAATDDAQLQGVIGQLASYYAAGRTLSLTYYTQDPQTDASIHSTLATAASTLETIGGSLSPIAAGLSDIATQARQALSASSSLDQLAQLAEGLSALSTQYAQFGEGLAAYVDGVAQLAGGYAPLRDGVASLRDGASSLADGVRAFADGTATLHEETKDMPQTMREEIDALLDGLDASDFTPISFAADGGTPVASVQFILMAEGISLPEPSTPEVTTAPNETIWDRLKNLF